MIICVGISEKNMEGSGSASNVIFVGNHSCANITFRLINVVTTGEIGMLIVTFIFCGIVSGTLTMMQHFFHAMPPSKF